MPSSSPTSPFHFTLLATSGAARRGRIVTSHGTIETPVFMPVGTKATVKALTVGDLKALGAQIILCNTFHMEMRPGSPLVETLGGLHTLMKWDRPILTDSGGFQVFSLPALRQVTEEGAAFRSPIDGTLYQFTPETALAMQRRLGSDIVMAFDECIEAGADEARVRESSERTLRWLARCRAVELKPHQTLFPIAQGGHYEALRRESMRRTLEVADWRAVAIGGLSVGESKSIMYPMIEASLDPVPAGLPRYLMGVGTPEDLIEGVHRGIDMFDCVYPSRAARTGRLFVRGGHINIKNARWREDPAPLVEGCDCECCTGGYSRAYLHHLFMCKEILGHRLHTVHNIRWLVRLMEEARKAIEEDRWTAFRQAFHAEREEFAARNAASDCADDERDDGGNRGGD